MTPESNLYRMQTAVDTLIRIARDKIEEDGWVLMILSWQDGDFELEYRHSEDTEEEKRFHRFTYRSKDPDNVEYCIDTLENMEEEFEKEHGKTVSTEMLPVSSAPKERRIHSFEHFELMQQCRLKNEVGVEITFSAKAFKKDPATCINFNVVTDDPAPSDLSGFCLEDLLSLQCAIEAVLYNIIRPMVQDRLNYDKNVKRSIDGLITGISNGSDDTE